MANGACLHCATGKPCDVATATSQLSQDIYGNTGDQVEKSLMTRMGRLETYFKLLIAAIVFLTPFVNALVNKYLFK